MRLAPAKRVRQRLTWHVDVPRRGAPRAAVWDTFARLPAIFLHFEHLRCATSGSSSSPARALPRSGAVPDRTTSRPSAPQADFPQTDCGPSRHEPPAQGLHQGRHGLDCTCCETSRALPRHASSPWIRVGKNPSDRRPDDSFVPTILGYKTSTETTLSGRDLVLEVLTTDFR